MNQGLSAGAYESLHTRALDRALGAVPHATPRFDEVEPAEAPDVLARHVADAVRRALQEEPHHRRLEKINDLLAQVTDDADVVVALEQLLALTLPEAPGVHRLVVRPATSPGGTARSTLVIMADRISELRLTAFKSFLDVALPLAPLTVLIRPQRRR